MGLSELSRVKRNGLLVEPVIYYAFYNTICKNEDFCLISITIPLLYSGEGSIYRAGKARKHAFHICKNDYF